jgi:protein-S-isoprenylcysteine O-methyltransferase Ste14
VSRAKAALGSAVFLVIAPGVVAGLVPWWLTGWNTEYAVWFPLRLAGAAVIVAGAAVLLHAFTSFVVEGVGTPAPVVPTERLVVGGLYRYVRNPMYLAVIAAIVGQAVLLGRLGLLIYAAALWLLFAAFVRWYEEPNLEHRYGDAYESYRNAVPAWLPKLR